MSAITYTAHARAPLIAGHTAGVSYSFDIGFRAHDESIDSPKKQHESLDGTIETVLEGMRERVNLTIGSYPESSKAMIREFIYSVAGGEEFTIDLNGTASVPDAPEIVKMANKNNQHQRVAVGRYIMSLQLKKV